jgi:hypothetical protein
MTTLNGRKHLKRVCWSVPLHIGPILELSE